MLGFFFLVWKQELNVFFGYALCRFKDVFAKPADKVVGELTQLPVIKLGDDGKPIVTLDADGKPVAPPTTRGFKYSWAPGEGDVAWKYTYSNPEDNHYETHWATGLTLNVSSLSLE